MSIFNRNPVSIQTTFFLVQEQILFQQLGFESLLLVCKSSGSGEKRLRIERGYD